MLRSKQDASAQVLLKYKFHFYHIHLLKKGKIFKKMNARIYSSLHVTWLMLHRAKHYLI